LYVSHDLPEVVKHCEHMLLMDAGKIVEFGKTMEVIAKKTHLSEGTVTE
jgi:ABC-type dipeptide/oligopeptide/nickel transport system ATPase component